MTGWRRVCEVMARATVRGPQASPKGLRHGFGVAAVTAGVPLNLVQKWLGHAQLSTTAIYADAVGEEEHAIAARFRGARAHDYEWLLVLYAEQGGARLLASVVPHFVRVNSLSTDMRYTPGTMAAHEAQAFVEAAIAIITWADGRLEAWHGAIGVPSRMGKSSRFWTS